VKKDSLCGIIFVKRNLTAEEVLPK